MTHFFEIYRKNKLAWSLGEWSATSGKGADIGTLQLNRWHAGKSKTPALFELACLISNNSLPNSVTFQVQKRPFVSDSKVSC